MINKLLFLVITLLISTSTFGQLTTMTNQKGFGGSGDDYLGGFLKSPLDDTFFLIGSSDSNASFDKSQNSRGQTDIWIIKTDEDKNVIWDKTIGGDGSDLINATFIENNKIYILATSYSGISGEKTIANFAPTFACNLWLLCLDLDGNILWQEVYGGSAGELNGRLLKLNNGNLLMSCMSLSNISGNKTLNTNGDSDIWMVEINPLNGSIINQNSYGSVNEDILTDVKQRDNDEIYVLVSAEVGVSFDKTDPGYGNRDIWLVVLNPDYSIKSNKCFGGNSWERESGANVTLSDNFFYLSCTSISPPSGNKTALNWGGDDRWLLKIDYDLNIIWDKSYGGTNTDYAGSVVLFNNKLILSGQTRSGISGNKTSANLANADCWVLVLDGDGNILNDITVGSLADDFLSISIIDSNFSFAGDANGNASGMKTVASKGGYDFWIFDFEGGELLSTDEISEGEELQVFPNPFDNQVQFNFNNVTEDVEITITTLDGKIISKSKVYAGNNEIIVPLNSPNSVLIYHVKGAKTNFSGKLVGI